MAPDKHLTRLEEELPGRTEQLLQMSTFLNAPVPNVPCLVLYGQEATGKTMTISKVLPVLNAPFALVDSRECITGRHLLERTVAICKDSLEQADYGPFENIDGRCESLSALTVQLQRLLERCPRFHLAFDGIDGQREAPGTLLPALVRLGESIPSLTVIFLVSHPPPLFAHKAGIPHIEFPPYTKAETLEIIDRYSLPIYSGETPAEAGAQGLQDSAEDVAWLWHRFCGIVWDSLGRGAARDVANFQSICNKIWPAFVQPIRDGSVGPRELSKLVNRTRTLFQNEEALRENIVPAHTSEEQRRRPFKNSQELTYYSKYLLIAAYLASHNPPRTDDLFFMKMHEKKKRKTKKSVAAAAASGAGGRPMKHRKVQRRLLGAQPFVLERLLAIFHAILPHPAPPGSADLLTQVSTLSSLRLIIKTVGAADILDPATKWRVNVGWEYVQGLSRAEKFELEDFVVD